MRIVDSHQHFWRIDRGDYGWLTPQVGPIYRDCLPEHLAPQLARAGVGTTVLVQAAPTVAETRYLLELAHQHPFIAGVVGWVDFESPDAVETIAKLAEDPQLLGLRPMIQDIPDPDWMLDTGQAPAFEAMLDHGLVFDALVLLAAGGWTPDALRRGHAAVVELGREMHAGRQQRLIRLGFAEAVASRLSDLHTRNFM